MKKIQEETNKNDTRHECEMRWGFGVMEEKQENSSRTFRDAGADRFRYAGPIQAQEGRHIGQDQTNEDVPTKDDPILVRIVVTLMVPG